MLLPILVAVALLLIGSLTVTIPQRAGALPGLSGALLGIAVSFWGLLAGEPESLLVAWPLPVGNLKLGIDALSSFFLLILFGVTAGVIGWGALLAAPAQRLVQLLAAAGAGVLLARDGVLFVICWELVALGTFLGILQDHASASMGAKVRRAAAGAVVVSQLGVLAVFLLFGLLSHDNGVGSAYDFEKLLASPEQAGLCFILALVGFGSKAGLWPVYSWVPDADAAAPASVTALFSGAIKPLGFYGLLRVLPFLGMPESWWGSLLIGVGLLTGLSGVIYALSELDGRRVLSWSTLENMGIIATGLGLALVAETLPEETGQPLMLLAMLGVLAHLLNHSLAKTTLLLGLGAVERACGTRKLDALGGLSWVMPRTSWAILVGSMALAGVPILNVFAGEWLLFSVAFQAAAMPGLVLVVGVILGLALISGLAVAVFTRFYGILFLGAPREGGRLTGQTADPGMAAAIPMVAAACCIALGIFPAAQGLLASRPLPVVFPGVIPGALPLTGLQWLTAVVVVFAGICLTGIWLLQKKLEERMVRQGPTWGCGYAHPSPRMQYTAASFSEPLLLLFGLNTRPVLDKVTELFPNPTATPPTVPAAPSVLEPLKLRAWAWVDQVRQLQHGRTQIYLSYVLATLLALFFWQLS